MRAGVASRTAFGVARRRAAHQVLDRPLVFEDPIALKIVGLSADASDLDRKPRTLRAFVAARSRFAEDELAAFVRRGGRQYVVLGAGLDTFAYRHQYGPALRVIEVDHPDTQVWKRGRLQLGGIAIPESVTFLPVDFEKQGLQEALGKAPEFDGQQKAFFSWLGVTPYLSEEAMEATLRCIAGMPVGSGVVFDYAVTAASLGLVDRMGLRMLARRVAQAGEAFRLFLEPEVLCGRLREMGFATVSDLGRDEINARYFSGRSDGLEIRSGIGRLISASV